MIFAYILTYVLLFVGIFVLSIFARKYLLNENMRAKLGKKNNYIGALFSLINGYVLVYFIILPAFSLNLVSVNSHLTNFVLENPPPFSRIARTAEKAVPVKGLADKASNFEQLLSVDGIEGYYNEAIYEYQLKYVGGQDLYEKEFMTTVYNDLTVTAKTRLNSAYLAYFGEPLTISSYYGVSYILVTEGTGENLVYQDLLEDENDFQDLYRQNEETVADYEAELEQYDIKLASYVYKQTYDAYLADLQAYETLAETFITSKINALKQGVEFTDTFTEVRPELTAVKPANYVDGLTTEPIDPATTTSQTVLDAYDYVEQYEDKVDISSELQSLGRNFANHKGLITWYIDILADGENADPGLQDISATIVSFKTNYELITEGLKDQELKDKLYLAMMSIQSYDVFTIWLEHTMDNIENVPLDDIPLQSSRCPEIDTTEITTYDFANDALSLVSTLFKGESVSWIITQYKYDYEAGLFDEVFADYDEVNEILLSTKELVDEYDTKYKDIANSIDGNISMLIKIGISVMKYNLDVYDTIENTPLITAAFNDFARFCPSLEGVPGYDTEICPRSAGEGGMFGEFINMRYLISEIYFKAYFMVDENNEAKVYDTEAMYEYLAKINKSVEDHVITKEVITIMADQFAFNVIDETNGLTLLEQMYEEEKISIEAMRVLANDDYELFSDDFRAKVRSLIR